MDILTICVQSDLTIKAKEWERGGIETSDFFISFLFPLIEPSFNKNVALSFWITYTYDTFCLDDVAENFVGSASIASHCIWMKENKFEAIIVDSDLFTKKVYSCYIFQPLIVNPTPPSPLSGK